jgi:hypothetical protein
VTTETFDGRMALALAHEKRVLASIQQRPWWVACEYGQGMLTPQVRQHLGKIDTPLRWHPDLLAIRTGQPVAYGIDAKASERQNTSNFDIQKDALSASHDWYVHMRLPLVIVWYDGRCNFTWDLLSSDAPLREGRRISPRRTPYWLWPKTEARGFDTVFGKDAPAYGPPPDWRMREIRRAG